MPTFVEPGAYNVYVPGADTQATLAIIAFLKSPKKYRYNSYVAYRPATRMQGIYLVLDKDAGARHLTMNQYAWRDGANRPEGNNNALPFGSMPYRTERYNIPFTVGNLSREQASWELVAAHGAMAAMQWATGFTTEIMTLLENPANWGTHTADANDLNGGAGFWDESDTQLQAFQRTIYTAVEQVIKDTNAMVSSEDLRLILGVEAARKLRSSREMTDFIKGSPDAQRSIENADRSNPNAEFGLPKYLAGLELIVENAVRVTTPKGGNPTGRVFLKDPTSALIVAKQDALPGDQVSDQFSVPNFSTFQVFHYTGAGKGNNDDSKNGPSGLYTVQTFEDPINEKLAGHIVTNFDMKLVAPESGFLITNVINPENLAV